MKRSDALLVLLLILFLGLVIWIFSTGRFNSTVLAFFDGIWNSIEGLIRPVFRR